ncbi:MAG: hypothetical protein KDB27_06280 [Planctomycetales bacterium]|nr:hypothetical protein [Planctomycetales bacterium]
MAVKYAIAILCCLLFVTACRRSTNQTVKKPSAKQAESTATDSNSDVDEPAAIEPESASPEPTAASEEDPADDNSDSVEENAQTDEVRAEPALAVAAEETHSVAEPDRLIVLSESGPVVLDLVMLLDGTPYQAAIESLIDDVLKAGDTDADGQTEWKELMSSKEFVYGQFGNPQINSEQQRVELEKTYDINRNKRVDRDEVLGFLRQDASNSYRFYLDEPQTSQDGLTASPVFRWLDTNGDQVLDEQERQSAVHRMWKNDADDNQILRPTDFESAAASDMAVRRRRREPRKVIVPKEYSDWSKLLYLVEEKYAYGNPLTVHDVPGFEKTFLILDADQDEFLSPKEFSAIMEITPHAVITIDFSNAAELITASDIDPDSSLRTVPVNGRRLRIELDVSFIEVVADSPNSALLAEQAGAMFDRADSDKNDALSSEEFTAVQPFTMVPFEAVDENGDDQVDRNELLSLLEKRQRVSERQITGVVGENSQSLFVHLDQNGDGQLTSREVREIPDRLLELDENGDGVLALSERPNQIRIQLTRGSVPNRVVPDQSTPQEAEESKGTGPAWFRSMDVNNDQEISHREFLGPIEVFEQLDKNGDAFLSADEATAAAVR